jgi:hypothetical protein
MYRPSYIIFCNIYTGMERLPIEMESTPLWKHHQFQSGLGLFMDTRYHAF